MKVISLANTILVGIMLSGCMSAQEHKQDVSGGPSTFTLGNVQSSIHQGMSQKQVLACLGSPNIVTKDDNTEKEVWVYDKISSENAYSSSSGGGGLGALGGGFVGSVLLGGIASVNGNKSAGAYETTQKTLTVMIDFDSQRRVQKINYHQSKF